MQIVTYRNILSKLASKIRVNLKNLSARAKYCQIDICNFSLLIRVASPAKKGWPNLVLVMSQ